MADALRCTTSSCDFFSDPIWKPACISEIDPDTGGLTDDPPLLFMITGDSTRSILGISTEMNSRRRESIGSQRSQPKPSNGCLDEHMNSNEEQSNLKIVCRSINQKYSQ
jgi:hypothetical protein